MAGRIRRTSSRTFLCISAAIALLCAAGWSSETGGHPGAVTVSVDGIVPVSDSLPLAVSVSVAKSQAMRKALEQGGRVESRSESLSVNFELIKDVFDLNAEGLLSRQRWERYAENGGQDWIVEKGFVKVHLEAEVVPDIVQDDWKAWERLMTMRGKPRFIFLRQTLEAGSGSSENELLKKAAFDALESGLRKRGMQFHDPALLKGLKEIAAGGQGFRLPAGSVLTSGEYKVDYLIYATVELQEPRVRNIGVRARKFEYDLVMACDIVDCSSGGRISSHKENVVLGPYSNFSSGYGERGGVDPVAAFRGDVAVLGEKIADTTYDRIMKIWSRLDNIATRILVRDIRSDELLLLEQAVRRNADGNVQWKQDISAGNTAEIEIASSMDPGTVMALFSSQRDVPLSQNGVLRHGHEAVFSVSRPLGAVIPGVLVKNWTLVAGIAALILVVMMWACRAKTRRK